MTDRENKLPIKCLSITGGGHNGFSSMGILHKTYDKLWNYDSIESIYSISSGTFVAVTIVLQLNVEHAVEYVLNRPFEFITFDSSKVISLFKENGMYGREIFIEFFKPLFASADLDINITLKNLYEHSNIHLNIYTSEINAYESVILSHETFPDLPVIDAVIMSASIPIIFKPICINDKYYFDGGFFKGDPYTDTLKTYDSCNILSISERYNIDKNFCNERKTLTTFSNFFSNLLSNTMAYFNFNNAIKFEETPTTFIMESQPVNPQDLYKLKEQTRRKELYDYGVSVYEEKMRSNEALTTESSENETL